MNTLSMENKFVTRKYSVLYKNRFCDQKNFDFIFTGLSVERNYLRSIYKVKGPSFTNVDTLVSDSNCIEESLTSGCSIWLTCYHGTKKESSDTFKMSPRSNYMAKLDKLPV